ncbi:diacylglycerol/lipid kinase family protein [Edaphobacillus lindanitolerans]|uniref:Lipid kinase, YegS/Rv2252/BmrU family n=1 Tax=Edaphobacillus lindanitolerans TaxID=550447 RepID=A0A1U7PM75_9BACI|nr:diacylglycerol kinase family protein [Edaphobacillus lindanitolerans]SIT89463.1 lipid kinase, YegS/Rv2252/BmrU family [Edaphobacillus lindanitolerans]
MGKQQAVLILNPSSGKEKAGGIREPLERAIGRAGYAVRVCLTEKAGDAERFALQAARDGASLIVAAGGDGTVNEAVNGIAGLPERPLFAFIPLGTVNDFARALGIPLDADEAIRAFPDFVPRATDIGMAGDRYFMNIIAVGALAEGVAGVPVEQKSAFGPLAYAVHGARALLEDDGNELTLDHDHGRWAGEAALLLIALTNSTGGFERMTPEAETDDGLLHVTVIKSTKLPNLVRLSAALLFGKLQEAGAVETIRTQRIRVTSASRLVCNIDGDECGATPLEVSVLPGHLRVLAPGKTEQLQAEHE